MSVFPNLLLDVVAPPIVRPIEQNSLTPLEIGLIVAGVVVACAIAATIIVIAVKRKKKAKQNDSSNKTE